MTWEHDATVVSGPRGLATPTVRGGHSYRRTLTVPGEYRLQCSIHPTAMAEYIQVRRRR